MSVCEDFRLHLQSNGDETLNITNTYEACTFTRCKNSNKIIIYLSPVMRNPAFCICENKGADQMCGNCAADQSLSFEYIDSTGSLLPKLEISSF